MGNKIQEENRSYRGGVKLYKGEVEHDLVMKNCC